MVVGDITTGAGLLVIGARPGGCVAVIRAAQNGIDTTLVKRDAYRGTYLNYGCIPSKALIMGANLAHGAGNAKGIGIHADPVMDMSQLRDWKSDVVGQLTGGVEKLCRASGVDLVEGTTRFKNEDAVRIAHGGEGQGSETIESEHCIIATDSRAIQIPGFDLGDEPVWSSRDALEADTTSKRLVVAGDDYIGMELSTTLAKPGAGVAVVEMLDDILPGYESDVARVVRKRTKELDVDMHLDEDAGSWCEEDSGIIMAAETKDGEENEYHADKVLVTVGRSPITDVMDTESAGLEVDDRGFLPVDDRRRTDVEHIYAVSDVIEDTPMLTHVASKEGIVAAEYVAGKPVAFDSRAVPTAVFAGPEIGAIDITEADAEEASFTPVAGRMPFRASGRMLMTSHADGFVRVVADEESGFALEAQIVGPEASELIAELAFAIEMGATLEDVTSTIHTHPTLAEAVMEATEDALGQAIHTLNR